MSRSGYGNMPYDGPYGSAFRSASSAWPQQNGTPTQHGLQPAQSTQSSQYGPQYPQAQATTQYPAQRSSSTQYPAQQQTAQYGSQQSSNAQYTATQQASGSQYAQQWPTQSWAGGSSTTQDAGAQLQNAQQSNAQYGRANAQSYPEYDLNQYGLDGQTTTTQSAAPQASSLGATSNTATAGNASWGTFRPSQGSGYQASPSQQMQSQAQQAPSRSRVSTTGPASTAGTSQANGQTRSPAVQTVNQLPASAATPYAIQPTSQGRTTSNYSYSSQPATQNHRTQQGEPTNASHKRKRSGEHEQRPRSGLALPPQPSQTPQQFNSTTAQELPQTVDPMEFYTPPPPRPTIPRPRMPPPATTSVEEQPAATTTTQQAGTTASQQAASTTSQPTTGLSSQRLTTSSGQQSTSGTTEQPAAEKTPATRPRASWSQGPAYGRQRDPKGHWLPRSLGTQSQRADAAAQESPSEQAAAERPTVAARTTSVAQQPVQPPAATTSVNQADDGLLTPQQIEALQNVGRQNASQQSGGTTGFDADAVGQDPAADGQNSGRATNDDAAAAAADDPDADGAEQAGMTADQAAPAFEDSIRKNMLLPPLIGSHLHWSNKVVKYNPIPDNIDDMRQLLYKVDKATLLNSQQISDYWPHMTNVWLCSTKRAPGPNYNGCKVEDWECRHRRRVAAGPRNTTTSKGLRNRSSKTALLEGAEPCHMRIRIIYYTKHADTDEDHQCGLFVCKCLPEWMHMKRTDRSMGVEHNHEIDLLDKFKRSDGMMYFAKNKAEEGYSYSAVTNWLHDKYDHITQQAQLIGKQEIANVCQKWRKAHKHVVLRTEIEEPTQDELDKKRCFDLIDTTTNEGLTRALATVCGQLPAAIGIILPILESYKERDAPTATQADEVLQGNDIPIPPPGLPGRYRPGYNIFPSPPPPPPPGPRPPPEPAQTEDPADLRVQKGIDLRWQDPRVGPPRPAQEGTTSHPVPEQPPHAQHPQHNQHPQHPQHPQYPQQSAIPAPPAPPPAGWHVQAPMPPPPAPFPTHPPPPPKQVTLHHQVQYVGPGHPGVGTTAQYHQSTPGYHQAPTAQMHHSAPSPGQAYGVPPGVDPALYVAPRQPVPLPYAVPPGAPSHRGASQPQHMPYAPPGQDSQANPGASYEPPTWTPSWLRPLGSPKASQEVAAQNANGLDAVSKQLENELDGLLNNSGKATRPPSNRVMSLADELANINRDKTPAPQVPNGLPFIPPRPATRSRPASPPPRVAARSQQATPRAQKDRNADAASSSQPISQQRPALETPQARRLREQFQQAFKDRERAAARPSDKTLTEELEDEHGQPATREEYQRAFKAREKAKPPTVVRWNEPNETLSVSAQKRKTFQASKAQDGFSASRAGASAVNVDSDSESDEDLRELARQARARAANNPAATSNGPPSSSPSSTLNAAELLTRMGQARARFQSRHERRSSNSQPSERPSSPARAGAEPPEVGIRMPEKTAADRETAANGHDVAQRSRSITRSPSPDNIVVKSRFEAPIADMGLQEAAVANTSADENTRDDSIQLSAV